MPRKPAGRTGHFAVLPAAAATLLALAGCAPAATPAPGTASTATAADTLPGSTSNALFPSRANSCTPPAAAASDGSPDAIASSNELPNVSVEDGKTKISAEA